MEIIAHGLWTGTIYSTFVKNSNWKRAVFWAVIPDLIWGVPLVLGIVFWHLPIPHDFGEAPWWFYHFYAVGHSLIISLSTIVFVSILKRKLLIEMLAWPILHILVDVPGHIHFLTPIFYPISTISFMGFFSWNYLLPRVLSYTLPLLFILGRFLFKHGK